MRKFNEYDFVKFDFVKDVLLFGKREAYFIRLGVFTWLAIIGFVTLLIITSVLIYQYIQLL